ncbi:MAG TPA: hypothetical protein VK034_03270 [Enhygromyxa sp.]|nr:hypothetical protein [Enhygromyxa sp.]
MLTSLVLLATIADQPAPTIAADVRVHSELEGCPGLRELDAIVADQLRQTGIDPSRLAIDGHLHPSASGVAVELVLTLDGYPERHRLAAPHCELVIAQMHTLISLVLRPQRALRSLGEPVDARVAQAWVDPVVQPKPAIASVRRAVPVQVPRRRGPGVVAESAELAEPDAAIVPPDSPTPSITQRPAVPARSGPGRLRIDLRVRGLAVFNLYPGIAGGPSLRVDLGNDRGGIGLGATAWLGGRFEAEAGLGSGRVDGWSAQLHGCGNPVARRWTLFACAEVGGGQLIGQGVAVPEPLTRLAPWVWAGAELGVGWWPRSWFGLELSLLLAGSLLRPAFHALDARFTTGAVFGGGSLGLVFNPWTRSGSKKPRPPK